MGFSGGSVVKSPSANVGSISGLRRYPGGEKWQLTPVFLPGEFYGLYGPWGRKELDTTEQTSLSFS